MSVLILFAVGLTVSGGLLAWIACETLNARRRRALAEEMTAQVRERYKAYVLLERRVGQVIGAFDIAEREFGEKLSAVALLNLELRSFYFLAFHCSSSRSSSGGLVRGQLRPIQSRF